jgi:Spy/CpxP family protein refolding chaperone
MNKLMTKSMIMLAALFVTVFASSCTDQLSSTAPIMDDFSSESSAMLYDVESIANSIIDDHDMGMNAKGDRGRGPGRGHGKDDRDRDDHRGDSAKPKRPNLRAVIDCLKLTPEQMTQLQALHQAKHDCEKAAKEQLKATVEPIRLEEKALHESLKAQVKAKTITRAEAHAQMKAFKDANAQAMRDAAQVMRAAVKICNDTFLAGIEALLTPDQLILWNKWKTTGANPCDVPVNG